MLVTLLFLKHTFLEVKKQTNRFMLNIPTKQFQFSFAENKFLPQGTNKNFTKQSLLP